MIYHTVPFIEKYKAKVSFNWKLRKYSDRKIIAMPCWHQDIVHYFDGRFCIIRYDENGYLRAPTQSISKERALSIILSYRKLFRRKSELYKSFRKPFLNSPLRREST